MTFKYSRSARWILSLSLRQTGHGKKCEPCIFAFLQICIHIELISTFASFYGLLRENNINCVKYLNLIFSIFIIVDFYARVWIIWIFVTFDHCVDGPRNVVRWFYEQNKAIFWPFLVSSTYCKIPVDNIQQVFEICCNEINFNK